MECDAYGIEQPQLRERFDRFDEGVKAIVALLSQETTTLNGKYVRLTEARCEPKPVQRPHPPITIGGRGRTRTPRTTAPRAPQWDVLAPDPPDWPPPTPAPPRPPPALRPPPAPVTPS